MITLHRRMNAVTSYSYIIHLIIKKPQSSLKINGTSMSEMIVCAMFCLCTIRSIPNTTKPGNSHKACYSFMVYNDLCGSYYGDMYSTNYN